MIDGLPVCGGTLITNSWVLTAESCLPTDISPSRVTFGFGMLLLSGIWWVSHHFHKQDEEEEAMSIRPEASRESH
jgi:hypothetical protein